MRKGKKIKISKQDRIYLFLVYLFLGVFTICVLYPLLYVVSVGSGKGFFSASETRTSGISGGISECKSLERIWKYNFVYSSRNSNRSGSFYHSILCALQKRISIT